MDVAEAGSDLDRTFALQALGIVERDAGHVRDSIRHFRRGVAIARAAGLDERLIDLSASLGTALGMTGQRRRAFEAFDRALSIDNPPAVARALVRRAAVMLMFDEPDLAHGDAVRAAETLADHEDTTWYARALNNAGLALLTLGRLAEADQQLAVAQAVFERGRHSYDAVVVLHNRGDCAHRLGDLPRALRMLYEARERYEELGVVPPEVVRDLAVVQLAAGLTEEAARTADELVTMLVGDRDSALRRADGFVAAATAHLAAGEPERAIDLARRAARSSRRQGHTEAERHALVVMLRAYASTGIATKRHARAAAALAAEIRDRYSSERLDALVLAGKIALRTGLADLADANLSKAAAERHHGSALRRVTAWYAKALLAQSRGERGLMLRACERGLDILDTHALSLGATELRARATVHGTDLAVLATRQVAQDGTARELLRWTERWRSALHSLPMPQSRRDPVLTAELGTLRAAERDLGAANDVRHDINDAERRRIEERIRKHVHGRAGDSNSSRHRFDAAELLAELGDDTTLVSVTGIKGQSWHTVVARRGRIRHLVGGPVGTMQEEIEYARFALRAAALAPEHTATALLSGLEPALARVEETLLGPALRLLGDGPVVLVPPATLQAAPWGALPSLRDRAVTVAPSATAWLRARRATPPRGRETVLVAGTKLSSAGAEVPILAETYPRATVLTGDDATTKATLDAIDGAWLAHIGAHGHYRGDNPMFSSLELADGPVTVFDFESLDRAPYRLLLTACESGVGAPTGADELLGLTSSLSALGTAGLLASVVPVSDAGSVELSLTVHDRLRQGDDFATALLAARQTARGPVGTATAWSFLALGAA